MGERDFSQRLVWIQALRALAALAVATVHLIDGFARYIDIRLHALPAGDQIAQVAVALFFIVSGFVMVAASGPLFGRAGAAGVFWRRRVVRVVPPYWIATLLLAAVAASLALPVGWGEVIRSLGFAFWRSELGRPGELALFLWPGWTLFYELLFYAVFGAFLWLPRGKALLAVGGALLTLAIVGQWFGPRSLLIFAVTRPVLLLFVAGVGFAALLPRWRTAPPVARLALLAAAVACAWLAPVPGAHLGFGYLLWAGLPGALVFLAAAGLDIRGYGGQAASVLGDASYAIYLLHVPFAHAWMQVFNIWLKHPGGSLGYLAVGVPLLVGLSIAFHRAIERPLTAWLNAVLGGSGRGSDATVRHAP